MGFAPLMLHRHKADLDRLMRDHPRIFPEYDPATFDFYDEMPLVYRQGERYRDTWGCVWYNIQEGLEGQVVGHPLADWKALETWRPPEPPDAERARHPGLGDDPARHGDAEGEGPADPRRGRAPVRPARTSCGASTLS